MYIYIYIFIHMHKYSQYSIFFENHRGKRSQPGTQQKCFSLHQVDGNFQPLAVGARPYGTCTGQDGLEATSARQPNGQVQLSSPQVFRSKPWGFGVLVVLRREGKKRESIRPSQKPTLPGGLPKRKLIFQLQCFLGSISVYRSVHLLHF